MYVYITQSHSSRTDTLKENPTKEKHSVASTEDDYDPHEHRNVPNPTR